MMDLPGAKAVMIALAATLAGVVILGMATGTNEVRDTQVVPLAFAAERGIEAWSDEKIAAFLADPDNRVVLSEAEISNRNRLGPLQWTPSSASCRYIGKFITVTKRYELDIEPAESAALIARRQRCATQFQ